MSEDIKNKLSSPQDSVRRAWIMTDINECGDVFRAKEILIDFNDECNIYLITPDGEKVSPTKNLLKRIKQSMSTHMNGKDQHFNATETENGFLSYKDKKLINQLKDLREYIINNPYLEINTFNTITKGFISNVKYHIEGTKFYIEDFLFSYKGYNFPIPESFIEIGERKQDYYEEIVYISIIENLQEIGKNKYQLTIKKDDGTGERIEGEVKIPMFLLRRCNTSKFSTLNPFGYLYDNVILDETEIIPEWYLLMDYDAVISECKERIQKNKTPSINQVVNFHFGIKPLPVTDNTVLMIDCENSKAIDKVTNTDLDKSSIFKLSPTGLAISKSERKGINLPIELENNEFTLEFLMSANVSNFVNESIFSFKDNNYNTIFSLKVLTQDLSNAKQNLYINMGDNDYFLLDNISKNFTMYKLIYANGSIELRCNELTLNRIPITIDLTKISFFEVSSLNVPLCDIRLSKVSLADENILPIDIHYNKGYMLPPLIKGCRKLSNDTSYIFNSIRINYKDLGYRKDEKGIAWHKGDNILLHKNENEIISGIYNRINASAQITGIKSGNSFYVDDIERLNIYDTVKIIKFNKNLFKIFKILDIDESDNSIKVIDVTNGDLNTISDINESYIYARIFDNDITPSIEIVDNNGRVINASQYPDNNGNVKLSLLEDATTDDIFLSYILSTNYKNVVPNFTKIEKVFLDDVLCEVVDTSNIHVDNNLLIVTSDNKQLPEGRILQYKNDSSNLEIEIKIPLQSVLVNEETTIVEESIISTVLNNINISLDIANSSDLTIYTEEENIIISKSNILRHFDLSFTSTDRTIINNCFIIKCKLNSTENEKALLIDNIKISLNLKECKKSEIVYRKVGSNKIDDIIIIGTEYNNPYIKTILNTNGLTNVLITAFQEIPTVTYNKNDTVINTIVKDNKQYLIRLTDDNMVYLTEVSGHKAIELPNKVKMKGSGI